MRRPAIHRDRSSRIPPPPPPPPPGRVVREGFVPRRPDGAPPLAVELALAIAFGVLLALGVVPLLATILLRGAP